jgi:hypothetical protein
MNEFQQSDVVVRQLFSLVEKKLSAKEQAMFCGLLNTLIKGTVQDVQIMFNNKFQSVIGIAAKLYSSDATHYEEPVLKRKQHTLAMVNKAIQAKYPTIMLVKGEGYFYIASNDDEMGLKIAGLYTSSIPVYSINQLSIEKWVAEVDQLVAYFDEETPTFK